MMHARMFNLVSAISDFDKALEINPNHAVLLSERGVLHFKMKNNTLALNDFDAAALLEPTNPYRFSSRAFIKSSTGDLQGAIEDYEMAIRLDPEDLVAHNNLGLVYEKLGYKEKSKKSFEKADQNMTSDSEKIVAFPEINKSGNSTNTVTPIMPNFKSNRRKLNYLETLKNVLSTKSGFADFISFLKGKSK
jgi:tetratricopeptide (TPR) repeat protein